MAVDNYFYADFRTKRTARKEHTCDRPGDDCDGIIRPGEVYFDSIVAPWTEYVEDYDPEYGASVVKVGRWEHNRLHRECLNQLYA